MKKRIKKLLFAFIFGILFTPNIVFAEETTLGDYTPDSNTYYGYSYLINRYDVNIVVGENNILDITENITANFKSPKHGIVRTIPLKNNITRVDGTTATNRTLVTDLSINEKYKTSKTGNDLTIKIGDADTTLTGVHSYTIKYKYNLGKDVSDNFDELYYNIIGTEWDTVIGNPSFTITMPKEFDTSKVGFSVGSHGTSGYENLDLSVDGNVIVGKYKGILDVGNGITIRVELPEGYFVDAGLPIDLTNYIGFIFPTLFIIIAFLLWHNYGKDNDVIDTVEFYPPEGFNSLEIGFIYKGYANNQDVTSLLIYLANKGYLIIEEKARKKSLLGKNDFAIRKLKDYDGNNYNEELFLKGLFRDGDEVTPSLLENEFFTTVGRIIDNIEDEKNKAKYMENGTSEKSGLFKLMILGTSIMMILPVLIFSNNLAFSLLVLLFNIAGISIMTECLSKRTTTIYVNGTATNSPIVTTLFGLFFGIGFCVIPSSFIYINEFAEEPILLLSFIYGFICIFIILIFLRLLPKRNDYGTQLFGKIKGFKNFLETAEKEKLNEIVNKKPTYFYDILPYTYVLGVSDEWINKFESITFQSPTWYSGDNIFDNHSFSSFMNDTMRKANRSMACSPSTSSSGDGGGFSSGGGGFSGGGSSGGGSGGGGGSSW